MLLVDNIKIEEFTPPPPIQCATLTSPANAATGINYLPAGQFSWTTATTGSAATGYDFYLGDSATTMTLLGSTPNTSVNITGLAPLTTYYWQIVPKNSDGSATGCTTFSFTTGPNPSAPYCGPLEFTSSDEPITSVNFAGINNQTAADIDLGVSHEFFLSQIANVSVGQSYDITLKGNTGGTSYTNKFAVFIDWDQNGVLNDAGEVYEVTQTITGSTGEDAVQAVHSIAVPATALPGNTRMRVKKIYGTSASFLDPCTGAGFGQAEDYTVNVSNTLSTLEVMSKNKIGVYPNPVSDILHIDAKEKIERFEIFDTSGKIVLSDKANSNKVEINVSHLSTGNYLLKVTTTSGTSTQKILKK